MDFVQLFQLVGAAFVLVAFVGAQLNWDLLELRYLVPNLVGSLILTVVALSAFDWGFLLLWFTWTVVTIASLIKYLHIEITDDRINFEYEPPSSS